MLSIVATLEEFQGMLLSADIHVFTDHKNLMFDTLKTQCVLHWRTKIEECSHMILHIKGPHNILANNLSRLNRLVTPAQNIEGKKLLEPTEVSNKEEDKAYFLIKNSLVFMTMRFGNVLSVISTYLKLHIQIKIC